MSRLYNFREWHNCLQKIMEIENKLKKEHLEFTKRLELKVQLQKLKDRFWDITQAGS